MSHSLYGTLITPAGAVQGNLVFGQTIHSITTTSKTGPLILPGFIDTHVHGGGGGDTMDGAKGVRTLAKYHLQHGSTTLFPTTITNPWDNIISALLGVREVMREADPQLASIPGAHLEGPFISAKRLGAQPPQTQVPEADKLEELLELDVIRLVTLAPEIPQALPAARKFAKAGVRVSIGHSAASLETVQKLMQAVKAKGGVVGFTHLYNAMGVLSGREPGIIGAALSAPESFAEIILDLHHVHPTSFLAALAAKPDHLHLITDGIRACGMVTGQTELGGQTVTVKNGTARLADGTLAGSLLSLDQALKNAAALGLSIEQASQLLSAVPASYMGLKDRGMLAVGKRADLVVIDKDLSVLKVYVAGRRVNF